VSWRGQLGHRIALEMCRLAPLCLMWCILREGNSRSFKDRETVMLELKKILFQSLYIWIVAFNSLPISNFSKFLEFVLFLYISGSFVYFLYARIVPLLAFNEFELLVKKSLVAFMILLQ
jgi:hypothetical protein